MAETETKQPTKKVDRKKLYILIALLAVLLIAVLAIFVIKPMMERIEEKEEQVQTLNNQYDSLLQQSNGYESSLSKYTSTKSKFTNQTDELFGLMYSDDADKNVLTPKIKDLGFTVNSVDISDLYVFMIDSTGEITTESLTYKQAVEFTDQDPVEETEEDEQVAEDTTSSSDDGVTYGEASEAIAGGDEDAETENVNINTGEYYYTLTYSLTGKYPEIVKLVNAISDDVSMSISELTFQSISDDSTNIEGDYSINVVIDIYMYEDPTTGVNDITEETSEEGESSSENTEGV